MSDKLQHNARDLEQELAWFSQVLDARLCYFSESGGGSREVFDVEPPDLSASQSPYADFLRHYRPGFAERLATVTSLVPHVRPHLLDPLATKNQHLERWFTEFGGVRRGANEDFWPTGETLAFLLAGNDLKNRFSLRALFDPAHFFARHNVLRLDGCGAGEPQLKAPLLLSEEYLSYFTCGESQRPDFGESFPARHMETELDWDDLVLHPGTRRQIEDIEAWLSHGDTLLQEWGMRAKQRPGYRSLFYGPPGTGKTMTACLLGKATGRDVYKVDLSLVVSKYIGETEKNLGRVFDQAQHKGWILFFDEADALFGKRSETRDAHDRYANQEVSFLLQRIETFDGVAILASNLRENMDNAFARRFESIIHFPLPGQRERLLLWVQGIPEKAKLEQALDLEQVAHDHPLTGGAIMSVIRYASLRALAEGTGVITTENVMQGIRRELAKEGKAA